MSACSCHRVSIAICYHLARPTTDSTLVLLCVLSLSCAQLILGDSKASIVHNIAYYKVAPKKLLYAMLFAIQDGTNVIITINIVHCGGTKAHSRQHFTVRWHAWHNFMQQRCIIPDVTNSVISIRVFSQLSRHRIVEKDFGCRVWGVP